MKLSDAMKKAITEKASDDWSGGAVAVSVDDAVDAVMEVLATKTRAPFALQEGYVAAVGDGRPDTVREALERAREVVDEILTQEIESYSAPEKTYREGSIKSSCGLQNYYNPDTINEADAREAVANSKAVIALIDEALAALASEAGVSEDVQHIVAAIDDRMQGNLGCPIAAGEWLVLSHAICTLSRQQPAAEATGDLVAGLTLRQTEKVIFGAAEDDSRMAEHHGIDLARRER